MLPKTPSGIAGLDEVTGGGLPRGRPTLVCGTAGCGKTLLSMEFIVRGAAEFDEPGVFLAFEETADELAQNVRSLGFDLEALIADRKLAVEYIHIDPAEIEETGEYDLEGLFIRLGLAIDSVGAKRVVLDTIEALFGGFKNETLLRAELRRLFRWLKDKGVTAVITAERGGGASLTRQGLEEYVSDCVILLDHRVSEQISTRRLRIVKYRGSVHGTNEYPFLIDERGISVLPVTSVGLNHEASTARVSSGIADLDAMLGGGYYRGSSVLVSGTAGTGKTSIAAHFAYASCERGERCLFLTFEESPSQLARNMRSIGLDLEPFLRDGTLHLHASRPTLLGLEAHLVQMHKLVTDLEPRAVVVDPISNFVASGSAADARAMLLRLIDFLKAKQITAVFTHLTGGGRSVEATDVGVSSLIDTWLLVRDLEAGGERNRGLYVIKSRGMAHSNQVREFLITGRGIALLPAYIGPEGVLTGSSRAAQEEREQAAEVVRRQELERAKRELDRRRAATRAQIAALEAELAVAENEAAVIASQAEAREQVLRQNRDAMATRRGSRAEKSKRA